MLKSLRIFFVIAVAACAQETLNNEAVVKMVKAGLRENVVIGMIQSQPGSYTLTPDALVQLKQDGVSDKVLGAMIARGSGTSSTPAAAVATATPEAGTVEADIPRGLDFSQGLGIGVYYKKSGKWEELLPEAVTWKTGGVVKHMASAGRVKEDVSGHLTGAHSRSTAASPVEVAIYAPEGVAITEYQLFHLRENTGNREFRTVTGGAFHEPGGAARDLLPFEGKKAADRIFRVVLPNLGAGEFGFLPPGAITSSSNTSPGKIYTFRLLE